MSGESVWLTQEQMSILFGRERSVITKHINHVFEENELNRESNVQILHIAGIPKPVTFYNLEVIISVGYRVKSPQGTRFRIWATAILREYIIKGFALNDERMKTGKNMNYFDELQARIREIRLSERFFYQKIKDIYTTSIDYNPTAEATVAFFKVIQNKLLWAISKQTAAELVARRANAKLPYMGMTSYDKKQPLRITRQDAVTAKNYLSEDEIKDLGALVEQYLAFAENQARRQIPMYMADWIKKLDDILKVNDRELLTNAGTISHQIAESISSQQLDIYREILQQQEQEKSLLELEKDIDDLRKTMDKK